MLLVVGGLTVASAGTDSTSPSGDTIVTSIVPAGGATDVDPNAPIELVFSRPMQAGMEAFATLHLGDVAGPVTPRGTPTGAWTRATMSARPCARGPLGASAPSS